MSEREGGREEEWGRRETVYSLWVSELCRVMRERVGERTRKLLDELLKRF